MDDFARILSCHSCSKQEYLGLREAIQRLVSIGMLKREKDPDPFLVEELLSAALGNLTCKSCGATKLTLSHEDAWPDDFVAVQPCEACQRPIAPERLEIFPNTTLCVSCQSGADKGEHRDEPDYCPKCGSVMEVKKMSAGITRYQLVCRTCRGI